MSTTFPRVPLATPLDMDLVGRYVTDERWVAEQKLDGHRLQLMLRPDSEPYPLSRNGTRYTKRLPTAVRNLRGDPSIVLDGELVGDTFWAFDVVFADTEFHREPLTARRQMLEQVAPLLGVPVIPQACTTEDKEALILTAAERGMEGVILKRADSTYTAGRSPHWLKVKFTTTVDVIVIGVRDDGKESAAVGIATDGDLRQVVAVGRCSLIGKPAVQLGDVVEVRCLYVTPDMRLYQPTLIRVRTDKNATECDGSDFRITNKQVLSDLPKGA